MAPADADDVQVRDNPSRDRYEVLVGSELAGIASYQLSPGTVIFVHTQIGDAFEGRGLGSRLARGALDDVRTRGDRVVAQCPFIAAYIERHDEYADLLDATG